LLLSLTYLKETSDKSLFEHKVQKFYAEWHAYPGIVDNFQANWEGCAAHWADFGCTDILSLQRRTNNHLERWMQTWKYDAMA
jgi:phage gp37-like protein